MADKKDNTDSFDLSGSVKKDVKSPKDSTAKETESVADLISELGDLEDDNGNKNGDFEASIANDDSSEVGFVFMLRQTFSLFFHKFGVFMLVTVLNFGIVFGFYQYLLPRLAPILSPLVFDQGLLAVIGFIIVISVLQILLNYWFYAILANQAFSAYNEQGIFVMESVKQAFKLTGRAINLTFKIFIYSRIWLLLFILLFMSAANTYLSSWASDSFSNYQLVLTIMNFVLGLGGLIVVILSAVRLVYASMAFPILMGNPEHSAKEVLERSVEITKGKWFLMVCFKIVFMTLLAIPAIIICLLNVFIFQGEATFNLVATIVSVIVALVSFPLVVSFYQILAQELANPGRILKLHIGILLLALLIFFAPIIISALAAYTSQLSLFNSFVNDSRIYMSDEDYESRRDQIWNFADSDSESDSEDNGPEKASTKANLEIMEGDGVGMGTVIDYDAQVRDIARMAMLRQYATLIDEYYLETGSYPAESGCVDDLDVLEDFIFGTSLPEDPSGTQTFSSDLMSESCKSGYYYQYFGGDNYLLYADMEDSAKGNSDVVLANLNEVGKLEAATSGDYFVMFKGSGPVDRVSSESILIENEAESAPKKVPRLVPVE